MSEFKNKSKNAFKSIMSNKNKKNYNIAYMPMGLALGWAIGTIYGNVIKGILLGLCIGFLIDYLISKGIKN